VTASSAAAMKADLLMRVRAPVFTLFSFEQPV
jgi:hypothetical protein